MDTRTQVILHKRINGERFIDALSPLLAEKGETLANIRAARYQPPFRCSEGKYYAEVVVESPNWLYVLRNNTGDGILTSTTLNPKIYKPECPPGHTLVERFTSDPNKAWKAVRITPNA